MFIFYQGLPQDTRKNHVTSCSKCMMVNMSFVNISRSFFFFLWRLFFSQTFWKWCFCACCVSVAMVKCYVLFFLVKWFSLSTLDWYCCLIQICLHSFDTVVVQTTTESSNKEKNESYCLGNKLCRTFFLMKSMCYCFSPPKTDRKVEDMLEKTF